MKRCGVWKNHRKDVGSSVPHCNWYIVHLHWVSFFSVSFIFYIYGWVGTFANWTTYINAEFGGANTQPIYACILQYMYISENAVIWLVTCRIDALNVRFFALNIYERVGIRTFIYHRLLNTECDELVKQRMYMLIHLMLSVVTFV